MAKKGLGAESKTAKKKLKITLPNIQLSKKVTLPTLLFIILLSLSFITTEVIFDDKIFPRVYIGDTNVSFLTTSQAYAVVNANFENRINQNLTVNYSGQSLTISLATASAKLDGVSAVQQAYHRGHEEVILQRLADQASLLLFGAQINPQTSFNIDNQLEQINQSVYAQPVDATLSITDATSSTTPSARVLVTPGKNGVGLDNEKLKSMVANYLSFGQPITSLPTKIIEPRITDQKASLAKSYLEDLGDNPIKLNFKDQGWVLDTKQLVTLLNFDSNSLIDNNKLKLYLSGISKDIDQPTIEAQFNFDPNTKRATAFKPAQVGQKLDIDKTTELITKALSGEGNKIISLPVNEVPPKVTTDQVNNMGIKELLASGHSNFAGSIDNRIFNIGLASSRVNGILIPPGEIFSFNNTVGEISGATGYKQAYVINNGKTVLDDGGGVCQVSTTIFRAALNAGLPIIARTAHAYRVGYYEQGYPPGLDATVFAPSVDLQFKNDTPGYILIQTHIYGTSLAVDIYGTSDGRVAIISKPVINSQTPPPPELRQDDPTLPKGTIKQVDFSAWGANVTFYRTIKRNNETLINETYHSNYRPWQAIFLVGTKEG